MLVVGLLLGLLLLIACCLGLIVWLTLGVAWLVGWVAVGLWLGQRLLQALNVRNASSIGEVALGVFLITVLTQLPACIGFIIDLVLGCTGLGPWRGPFRHPIIRRRQGWWSGSAVDIESVPVLPEPPSTPVEPATSDVIIDAVDTPPQDEQALAN